MEFYEKCKGAIETFDILVVRVHDIYSNRILNVLMSMQEVSLQTVPPGEFLDFRLLQYFDRIQIDRISTACIFA